MNSMFAKTLGWFLLTVTVAIGGILLTTALTLQTSGSLQSPFTMLLRVQVEDAKKAVSYTHLTLPTILRV